MSSISLANIKMQRMAAETVFLIPGSLPAADLERSLHRKVVVVIDGVMLANLLLA